MSESEPNPNEVIECKFTRHDLNILNNLIICMHERKAFKIDEFGRVAKVWELIRECLGFPLDNLDIPELEMRSLQVIEEETDTTETDTNE